MKWKEFEVKYSKELYEGLRRMCEEIHTRKQSRFCNYCHKREGAVSKTSRQTFEIG